MEKILMQNRIDPEVKQALVRYSQLLGVPMNRIIEHIVMDHIAKRKPDLKIKLLKEIG